METSSDIPRGIRNNNPLNIVHGPSRWLGRREEQTDEKFVQFKNMDWGCRAACILVKSYIVRHHCRTVRDIIYRWCPDGTEADYVKFVCDLTTFSPTTIIDWKNQNQMAMLLHSMAFVENGKRVPMHHFLNGWGLAFSNKLVDDNLDLD